MSLTDEPVNKTLFLGRTIADRAGIFIVLAGYLTVIGMMGSADVTRSATSTVACFVAIILVTGDVFGTQRIKRGIKLATGSTGAICIVGLYLLDNSTLAAWILMIEAYVILAWLDRAVVPRLLDSRASRWTARGLLALAGGGLPIILGQVESRFADEEFVVAIQGIELVGLCFLFLAGQNYLGFTDKNTRRATGPTSRGSLILAGGFAAVIAGVAIWGLFRYQHSFYILDAPQYPGLTDASPFLCGQVPPDSSRPSGEATFRQLVAQIEANPYKDVPELGMLALTTKERRWADAFRDAILAEADAGAFTKPTELIKATQHEAALRAYYAPRVRSAFSDLFSVGEWEMLLDWFAGINRRALTVESVDWLYALAFSKWPEGPYENQEHGAGLLAMLEAENLSPPDLSPVNQAYLERNRRGWAQRFRNTDDSYYYQPEWITNAYFQSLFWQADAHSEPNLANRQLSFEWLLLQALPDGAPLRYNHVYDSLQAGTAYLAAGLEEDPRFIWWSARMLDWASANDARLRAQPGVEDALTVQGASPSAGSCLIYGNSGLPNQLGPLAPDKIVLRDGWTPDAQYILLNLRFSGWHRYKATNDVVLIYQNGPIATENGTKDASDWLPSGRRLFRDKRVPRENLNGLLVARTGWSQIVNQLTRMGSEWAQDPPAYARVDSVEWLGPVDVTRTVIDEWRGWQHTRSVYFVRQGPVIVIDTARGAGQAAMAWHVVGTGRRDDNSLWLRDGPSPARMVLSPDAWQSTTIQPTGIPPEGAGIAAPNWDIVYRSSVPGRLRLATIFGTQGWASAQYDVQEMASGQFIIATSNTATLSLLQNDSDQWLEKGGLGTDGQWILAIEQADKNLVCFAGGTRAEIQMQNEPAQMRDTQGHAWPNSEWDAGRLTLHGTDTDTAVCVNAITAGHE